MKPNINIMFIVITAAVVCGIPVRAELLEVHDSPRLKGVFLIPDEGGSFINPGFIGSTPAVDADGTAYIASNDERLFALNPDGSVKWIIDGLNPRYSSTPAIGEDGAIYLTHGECISAFSKDGEVKWHFPLDSDAEPAPAIAADNTIIVASSKGILYALDSDGVLKWKVHIDGGIHTSPAIGPEGTIYVGGGFYSLFAITPWGIKWEYYTGNIINDPCVAADGAVYFMCLHRLYALDPDGTPWWITGEDYSGEPVIGEDGTIYVGGRSGTGTVHALDSDGTVLWESVDEGSLTNMVVGADGVIYTDNGFNLLCAFDNGGTLQWSHQFTRFLEMPVLAPDGTLYITANELYAFETDSFGYAPGSPWPNFMANNTRCITSPDHVPPPLHTISGYVVMPDSTPVADVSVSIDGLTTESNEEGYFSFTVPDGKYGIDIDTDHHQIPRHMSVTVNGSDTVVQLHRAERHTVAGRLLLHGAPLQGASVYAADTTAVTGPDGRFALHMFDGNYTLEFDGDENYFPAMKDITVDGRDVEVGNFNVYPIVAVFPTEQTIYHDPFWSGGKPYVTLGEGAVCRIDDSGFTKVYEFDDYVGCPAVADDNSMVFAGRESLYAINPDFTLHWEYPVEEYNVLPPIITDTSVYFGTQGYVLALTRDGELIWKRDFDTGNTSTAKIVLGHDGTLYVACYPGTLHACDPDGNVKWTFTADNKFKTMPVIADDGTILIGNYDHNLYAVNPDGSLHWKYHTGASLPNPPVSVDGVIYFTTSAIELTALTADGDVKWINDQYPGEFGVQYIEAADEIWGGGTGFTLGIDKVDGSITWRHPINFPMNVSHNGYLYALFNYAVNVIDIGSHDPVAVEERYAGAGNNEVGRPSALQLHPNYPNPFNPSTTISFTTPEAGQVRLVIHDINGQKVRELAAGWFTAGRHEVMWDGRDGNGLTAGSGIYIARLSAGGRMAVWKVTLMR